VSAPVAESECYDFKGANASAPMFHDKVKWPIYNKDIPFTWKKGTGKCDVKPRLYLQYTNTNTPNNTLPNPEIRNLERQICIRYNF
jgi:hypothetical protein